MSRLCAAAFSRLGPNAVAAVAVAALAVGLAVSVPPARAAEPAAPARPEPSPLLRAEELLRVAQDERDAEARFQLAEEARTLALAAARAQPKDPTPLIYAAQALSVADPGRPEVCRPGLCEEALKLLDKARALDGNGLEARRIADELALVYSRMGDHERALEEYRRALHLVDPQRDINSWDDSGNDRVYGNGAETLMALGRLEEAIAWYKKSLELSPQRQMAWELANWGLGVALDRNEELESARSAIRRALDIDPTMRRLSASNVFFEPPGDKWAYVALGHEVAGDREQAAAAWRAFLAANPSSRYAGRARVHLQQLKSGLGPGGELDRMRVSFTTVEKMGLGRSLEEIRRTLAGYVEDVRLCYARALRSQPRLRGELTLALEIHAVGLVSGGLVPPPRVVRSSLQAPQLAACIEGAASLWRFRAVDSQLSDTVTVTMELEPGAK